MSQRIKSMLHNILRNYKLILASQSPRRREIFDMLRINYNVKISDIAEPITDEDPALQAERHAKNKALAILASCSNSEIVVSADTIVIIEGRLMGKPADRDEAANHLRLLSGRSHTVITGICIAQKDRWVTAHELTEVRFANISEDEIRDYVQTNEPMDKAGAYGIQGFGSQFVTRINGCYFNVMGFPVHLFYKSIRDFLKVGQI